MRRWLIGLVVVAAAAGWWSRPLWSGGAAEEQIETAPVVRGPLRMTVQTTGPLRPVTTIPVGSEVSGTVAWLGADYNDRVTKGQVLAKLKTELFESRLAQAQATYDNTASAMKKAETAISDLKEILPVYTALAKSAIESAESTFDIADYNFGRIDALYKQGNAPEAEWRDARSKRENARSALERAKLEHDRAKIEERTRVVQAEQDLNLARANVAQAKASLDLAQRDLQRCTIESPIDGIVLRRLVSVGEPVVSALTAQHLFIVTPDLARMQLHANVGESDIGLVAMGQKADFTVDACGERTFNGVVTLVRNDPTTLQGVVTYQVMIDVDNAEGLLKPEMTANVSIEVVRRERAVKIRNTALRYKPGIDVAALQELMGSLKWPAIESAGDDGDARNARNIPTTRTVLWRRNGGQWEPTPVVIGITDNRETEILAGAREGDVFISNFVSKGGVVGSVKQALQMANPGNRSL